MTQESYDKYDKVQALIAKTGESVESAVKKENMGIATYYAVKKEKENPDVVSVQPRKYKKSGNHAKLAKSQPKPANTVPPKTLDIHLTPHSQGLNLKKVTVILCDADQLALVLGGLQ